MQATVLLHILSINLISITISLIQEYVNTLATIRQEKGEKYLVLKRKYYPQFDDDEEPRTAHPSAVNDIRGNLEPFVMA